MESDTTKQPSWNRWPKTTECDYCYKEKMHITQSAYYFFSEALWLSDEWHGRDLRQAGISQASTGTASDVTPPRAGPALMQPADVKMIWDQKLAGLERKCSVPFPHLWLPLIIQTFLINVSNNNKLILQKSDAQFRNTPWIFSNLT